MGFINYLINGISLDSAYAIIAPGYTMAYGTVKMPNFTYSDVIMIGSYVVFVTASTTGLPPMAGVLLAVVICTLLGMIIEWIAYRPPRGTSPLAVLITVIGVSYLLQNIAPLIFEADTKSFTSAVTLPATKLAGGEMTIAGETAVTILSCVIIIAGLTASINKSKAGQAILAVSEDRSVATLMGINVNGAITLIFAIGPALAAIAGTLFCSVYPSLTPYTGSMPGIKAFVAAVLGGIGSTSGTLIGDILLGVTEILPEAYISSQVSDAIVFPVLIIVFLAKPTGTLGKKINEKVQVPV